ncbi:hypothetical protein T05_10501 [Trichinella murrelli]|uniref:Uncharacterized protein n=1 Tax=Trichinella murrelli TaxID=144512 RepID=A0A0V0TSH9_9BILA|nr:hypothetical protein T05_10501 [Trichinella murrelli]
MEPSGNSSIVSIPLKYSPFKVSKKILTEFRYIENQTLQKTGNSPEAEESVDEVEASSLYPAMVDMLYSKWRFFKIAFFPLCMPGAHLHYSSLRDLSDKFELSLCRSVHGTSIHTSMTCTKHGTQRIRYCYKMNVKRQRVGCIVVLITQIQI